MCIAIYHEAGCALSTSEVENSWRANPDGGGFTYVDQDGALRIEKYMKLRDFHMGYDAALEENPHSQFAVHFRIATHGGVNIDNCHPFYVNPEMTLIHNGIIPVLMSKNEKRSDTRVFCQDYLTKLPSGWIDDEHLFDLVEEYIGGSKLVVLSTSSNYPAYIFNEKQGHWSSDNNFWYSNNSYKTSSFTKAPTCDINQGKLWTPADDEFEYTTLAECVICESNSVFEDVCYNCDSCQMCSSHERDCRCYTSIHSMTDSQFTSSYNEKAIR